MHSTSCVHIGTPLKSVDWDVKHQMKTNITVNLFFLSSVNLTDGVFVCLFEQDSCCVIAAETKIDFFGFYCCQNSP